MRWLEGHLIELKTGQHPGQPPRSTYDPALHDFEEREQAKIAEFGAAGRPMTRRHLQRLRRAYREEGLIGLADRRKLREVTPGAETDPRVVAAIEAMLAEPRGRSTVARSVMFTDLQRRLDDEYGPGTVPVPHKRTLYRLMVHMDRGRRNFASEASRRTAINRPDRPFTPVTAPIPPTARHTDTGPDPTARAGSPPRSARERSLFQQEMRRTVAVTYRWPQPGSSKDPLHRWIIGGNRRLAVYDATE